MKTHILVDAVLVGVLGSIFFALGYCRGQYDYEPKEITREPVLCIRSVQTFYCSDKSHKYGIYDWEIGTGKIKLRYKDLEKINWSRENYFFVKK